MHNPVASSAAARVPRDRLLLFHDCPGGAVVAHVIYTECPSLRNTMETCDGERIKDRVGRGTWECLHAFPYTLYDFGPGSARDAVALYRGMVLGIFALFPCEKCRRHIAEFREEELRRLLAIEERAGEPVEETIRNLALWAFRLHNRVTRAAKPAGHTNGFLEIESRGTEAVLQRLDTRYNIVY